MPEPLPENGRARRNPAASRRREGVPPWENPHAESRWWFAPTRPPRVVDQAPDAEQANESDQANQGAAPARVPPSVGTRPTVIDATIAAGSPTGAPRQRRRRAPVGDGRGSLPGNAVAWVSWAGLRRAIGGWAVRAAVVVVAVCVLAIAVQGAGRLVRGRQPGGAGVSRLTPTSVPRPTPIPSPTPTPTQAELDGVITITNLDPQAPFEADVHVVARTGGYMCRNSPLPQSTWHIQLDPGASISVPCEIPVSSPPTLPTHAFRQAVPSADGSGLALVDNPAPFVGVAYSPTPAR